MKTEKPMQHERIVTDIKTGKRYLVRHAELIEMGQPISAIKWGSSVKNSEPKSGWLSARLRSKKREGFRFALMLYTDFPAKVINALAKQHVPTE